MGVEVRLLLMEDNTRLSQHICTGLRQRGFAVDAVGTGADGSAALETTGYDAIILDLGLPDVDGLDWLAQLRTRRNHLPVLILTARDQVSDLVTGLNSGADDYLRKPFEIDELTARIRALLRRPGHALGVQLSVGNVVFNIGTCEVTVADLALELGRREYGALEVLMRRSGRVVSKSSIEEALYSFGEELASNAIEVLIHRLRKRLSDAKATVSIHTLRGVGYVLTELRE